MAIYRCRMCEAVFRVDTGTPADVARDACIRGGRNPELEELIPSSQPHTCNAEEYIGLADFVGFAPKEKVDPHE